jgi:hypothetical protein
VPVRGYSREQEEVLRLTWKTLDADAQRAVWRSVTHGEAVAHPGRRRLAVWLSRRWRRTIPLQGAAGLASGLLLASILSGARQPPLPLVALALLFGLAQPIVAFRRYRRAQAAEAANLPPGSEWQDPAEPAG